MSSHPPDGVAMPRWRVWVLAARPRTLPAVVAPVLVGAAVAGSAGVLRPWVFGATLAAALLLQVASNLANDVSDFERGADSGERLGPVRVTQSGLLTAAEVRRGLAVVLTAAAALGAVLAAVGGWPIVVIGLAAMAAALAYTGGPWPFGYHGLGELFVFVFFGLVATTGTAYLQLGEWPVTAVAASLPVACTVTAILVVNNLRDLAGDRDVGKRTLAVMLGDRATRIEYALLLLAPALLVPVLVWRGALPTGALLSLVATVPSLGLVATVVGGLEGRALNRVLERTGQVHLLLGVLLAAGLLL